MSGENKLNMFLTVMKIAKPIPTEVPHDMTAFRKFAIRFVETTIGQ
jgi:hypothetical protein